MMQFRLSAARGHNRIDWLESWHSFSFGEYHDPAHMGFSVLRVINEDIVAPGKGFATHPHRDMEIITYVLEGALQHQDSLGNGEVIRPGDVQRMSAGTGVRHSEFNPSNTNPVHLLQIWILPEMADVAPSYDQKNFPLAERQNNLRLVVSRDGRDGSLSMNQDVDLYAGVFDAGEKISFDISSGRHAWLQVARGRLDCESTMLKAGDGASFSDTQQLRLHVLEEAEILLFDLP